MFIHLYIRAINGGFKEHRFQPNTNKSTDPLDSTNIA